MRIAPEKLYAALQRAQLPVNGYGDPAAALAALARVESNYDDSLIGDLDAGGSYGLWQVNRPSWPAASYPPPPFPAQLDWLRWTGALDAFNASGATNLPRWWRHGARVREPDGLDVQRESTFRIEYARLTGSTPSELASAPLPPSPGGDGGGAIFPVADVPAHGETPMTATAPIIPPVPSSTLKEKLHAIRLAADKVRATVDQVATVVTSIPFVGAMLGAYVRGIVAVVDGLDATIDALDGSL